MNDYPEYITFRTVCGRGRVTNHPEWSSTLPWVSYIDGTAGKQFRDLYDAAQYFRALGMVLKDSK